MEDEVRRMQDPARTATMVVRVGVVRVRTAQLNRGCDPSVWMPTPWHATPLTITFVLSGIMILW